MRSFICVLGTLSIGATAIACSDNNEGDAAVYDRMDLISDRRGDAPNLDINLVNPWGIAFGDETAFWIANNETSTATVCNADGQPVLEQTVAVDSSPTGVVYNPTEEAGGFMITDGIDSVPAEFIFATLEGTLVGWSAELSPTQSVVALDDSDEGAVYTGLAVSTDGPEPLLYAADFAGGAIHTYGADFADIDLGAGAFVDPSLPAGYSPFGVQAVDGMIVVTYAKQGADDPSEEVHGPGFGYVSAFDPDGSFIARVMSSGELNAPWAVVHSPTGFGAFSDALLIGNLGDGRITALDPQTYDVLGQLEDANHDPLMIEGLWGLTFGNDLDAGRSDTLYFAAGVADETHGLFGRLTPRIP
jgi:uncharacterized protein (TIGR03118 family)